MPTRVTSKPKGARASSGSPKGTRKKTLLKKSSIRKLA